MQTQTVHTEKLLLDGVFDIPKYQRSYSWDKRQLSELLEDIRYLPDDSTHFFGNVILDKKEEPYHTESARQLSRYHIVDGQQRLTTVLIFLRTASELEERVRNLIVEGNVLHVPKDRPRLLPQDNDREFFRDHIMGDSLLTPETPSQTRLEKAQKFFRNELSELQDGVTVVTLANRLLYDFEINVVEVDDDSEAASIFESINDRGKPLSSLDKTKSYLMYMDDRASTERSLSTQIHDRFGGIYRELFVLEEGHGHDRAGDFDEDSLLQFHWGLYAGYDSDEYYNSLDTLKERLYETYRSGEYEQIDTIINEYTASLREASIAFAKIFQPEDHPTSVQNRLNRLLTLGRLANILPILMAAQLEYGSEQPDKLETIIEKCETFVFRVYAIDRKRSDTGIGPLVRLAHRMYSNSDHTFDDTVRKLEGITREYTEDDRFESALRDEKFYESIRSSRDKRYLLYHYGQQLEAKDMEFVERNLEQILSSEFQVEHILAQQLDEEFIPNELREEFEDNHVHRLGNLTIANQYWNKTYGTLPFQKKKQLPEPDEGRRETAYETSSLKVQRVLAEVDEFNGETIDKREDDIVEFSLEEWSLSAASSGIDDADELLQQVEGLGETHPEELDESGDWNLSTTEFYALSAVLETPGRALRSVHRTAASFDESSIEWTDSWSSHRTDIQRALHSLRGKGLVELRKRSWYPKQPASDD